MLLLSDLTGEPRSEDPAVFGHRPHQGPPDPPCSAAAAGSVSVRRHAGKTGLHTALVGSMRDPSHGPHPGLWALPHRSALGPHFLLGHWGDGNGLTLLVPLQVPL